MTDCNADLGHPCDANDGEPCADCRRYLEEQAAYWRRAWARASPQERNPEQYERDMIDAGRGHLLGQEIANG